VLWTDNGFGDYGLYYLRTKDKREVNFCVTKDRKPWFLVKVKTSAPQRLHQNLEYFQTRTGAKHAFEVVMDADFVDADCFEATFPIRVPARTFLSQLV